MSLDELLQQAATFTGYTLEELQMKAAGAYESKIGQATRTFEFDNQVSILVFLTNKIGWHFEKEIPGNITFILYTDNGLRNINEYKMMEDGKINEDAVNLFKKEFTVITQHPDWVKCEKCGEFVPKHETSQSGFAGAVCHSCLTKGHSTQTIDTMGD